MLKYFLVLLLSATSAISFAEEIVLSEKGNTNYIIAVTGDAIESEKFASEELVKFLSEITGANFQILNEDAVDSKRSAIYVGNTKFAKKNNINSDKLNREEWIILPASNKSIIIAGGRPRGALYGVHRFLEKLGCRFLAENCNIVPRQSSLSLNLEKEQKQPQFAQRQINDDLEWGDAHANSTLFKIRNAGNAYVSDKFGSYDKIGSPGPHHTFFAYSEKWPDDLTLFSLNDAGKRLRAVNAVGPGQICMTNPKSRELTLQKLKEFIREDRKNPPPYPVIYDISQNDNGDKCVCPNCKSLAEKEGSYAAPVIEFINFVANGVKDEYPDVKIRTFAYVYGKDVPKSIHAADNVIIRLAPMGYEFKENRDTLAKISSPHNQAVKKLLENWSKAANNLAIWDYWILYATDYTAPYANIDMLQENLKFYRDNKYKNLYIECEWPYLSSFSALRRYVGLQLMIDPDQDLNRLINDFMAGYYGKKAAPLMLEYLNYMNARQKGFPLPVGQVPPPARSYMDIEFFTKTLGLLDESTKLTENPEQKKAILREYTPLLGGLAQRYQFLLAENKNQALNFDIEKRLSTLDSIISEAMTYYLPFPNDRARFDSKVKHLVKDYHAMVKTAANPQELRNKSIISMYPVQGRIMGRAKKVSAPDSIAGQAIALGADAKNRTTNGILNLAVNDFDNAKNIIFRDILLNTIKDEQYHLYKIGKVVIPNSSAYVSIGWTCEIQFSLEAFYLPNTGANGNTYDVYASVKVQGPDYIPKSTKPNGIFVERVILTK